MNIVSMAFDLSKAVETFVGYARCFFYEGGALGPQVSPMRKPAGCFLSITSLNRRQLPLPHWRRVGSVSCFQLLLEALRSCFELRDRPEVCADHVLRPDDAHPDVREHRVLGRAGDAFHQEADEPEHAPDFVASGADVLGEATPSPSGTDPVPVNLAIGVEDDAPCLSVLAGQCQDGSVLGPCGHALQLMDVGQFLVVEVCHGTVAGTALHGRDARDGQVGRIEFLDVVYLFHVARSGRLRFADGSPTPERTGSELSGGG